MPETNETLAQLDLASTYAIFVRARATWVATSTRLAELKEREENAKQDLRREFEELQKGLRELFERRLAENKQKWCSTCKKIVSEDNAHLMLCFTCYADEWPFHADSWEDLSHWSYLLYACDSCYEARNFRIPPDLGRNYEVSFYDARFTEGRIELHGKTEGPWFAMEGEAGFRKSLHEKRDERLPKYFSFQKAVEVGLITPNMYKAYGDFDIKEIDPHLKDQVW
jgi:hypothetical protein